MRIESINSFTPELHQLFKELMEFESSVSDFFNLVEKSKLDESIVKFFDGIFKRDDNAVFIAIIDDQVIGFVIGGIMSKLSFNEKRFMGYVESLYVKKGHRMKGVGTKLMDSIEDYLLHKGLDCSTLFIMNNNNVAKEFYSKAGYEIELVKVTKTL